MKKITLLLIMLILITGMSSAASYNLKKTINGVGVITTIPEGNSVTLTYVGEGNFSGWEIREGSASIANLENSSITFAMPANNLHVEAVMVTHTHSYSEATCTTPPTCSCGVTQGEALGHTWVAAICTAPKTCSVCSETEGIVLAHSYTVLVKCNENGSTDEFKCATCSATQPQTCTHKKTVTFNKNSGTGSMSSQECLAGATITLTTNTFTRNNYIFKGWNTLANGNGTSYADGASIKVTADMTLYAQWKQTYSLASKVAIGDYVDYPVEYANITPLYDSYKATLTGWRVIGISGENVTLVSAGIPLRYYFTDATTQDAIAKLTTNFLTTSYSASGFDSSKTLNTLFTNNYTASVRTMTIEDIENALGVTFSTDMDIRANDLFGVPSEISNVNAFYYLASEYVGCMLVVCDSDGVLYDYYNGPTTIFNLRSDNFIALKGFDLGIRPVVTLNNSILTTGQDANGVWDMVLQ